MIKLDPNTDLSTVIKEFKEVKHFVDQIKGSGNPFSEFVDKGVRPDQYGNEKRTVQGGAEESHRVGIIRQRQNQCDDIERN